MAHVLGTARRLGTTVIDGLPLFRNAWGVARGSSAAVAQRQQSAPGPQQPTRPVRAREDAYKACLIDAAGTLLSPSEPAAEVYQRYASKYQPADQVLSQPEILARFRRAYSTPWAQSTIRYVGDGRPFWRFIVQESTLCKDEAMFEEVYQYYARAEAWSLSPGATDALVQMREAGILLAVVSNFDTRLRQILDGLQVEHLFDAVIISAEVGVEKPNRCIFEAALEALGVQAEEAVHVGDDRRNDLWGARDAGVHAWLWAPEGVSNFADLANRVIHGSRLAEWEPDD